MVGQNNSPKELIKDIKDKLQFLVTVEIFYSALIYGFFKAAGSNEIISNFNASIWAISVALCIGAYITIEELRERKLLLLVRSFLYASFICFIPLFILTSYIINALQPGASALSGFAWYWIFIISLTGSLWLPIIGSMVAIIFGICEAIRGGFNRHYISL